LAIWSLFFPGSDMSCVAIWREYLASLASIDASFFVASSEASQRCNSHPPDRQLAHETRASLRVFPLRVVLVSTVTVSKLYWQLFCINFSRRIQIS